MNATVRRSRIKTGYSYTIDYDSAVTGETNFTLGFLLPIRITVSDGEGNVYKLREANWLLKALYFFLPIPFVFINLEPLKPLRYYDNGVQTGKAGDFFKKSGYYFLVGEDVYEFHDHSHNYTSIMKNDVQIALIQKERWNQYERTAYHISYKKDACTRAMIMLFCIFIDTKGYPNRMTMGGDQYERGHVFGDEIKERTNWKP